MQVNRFHLFTFGMIVPGFGEKFYRVEGHFFQKIGLLILHISWQRRTQRGQLAAIPNVGSNVDNLNFS